MGMQPLEILLIDDNPNDGELTEHALKKMGIPYHLTCVQDGDEALALLSNGLAEHPPQLILTDLKLPRVDGFELLKRLRQQGLDHAIPIVVLTGSGREDDKAMAATLGAMAYIDKSLSRQELGQALRDIALQILHKHST